MEGFYLKVTWMKAGRLYLWILLLTVIGLQQYSIGQEKSAVITTSASEAANDKELEKQLRINRDALLKGSSEQIRVDAATVMLLSDDPEARKILLSVFKQPEYSQARLAICKALSQLRATKQLLKSKSDFITPLFDIIATEEDAIKAKSAADATLIFDYEQISKPIEKLITDKTQPVKIRLNAIEVLKLQPDMRAILKLMELQDDSDTQIVEASENGLQSLGIPVSKNPETRKQIADELKRKGKDEFLHDWLIRQEEQIRKFTAESDSWRELYIAALTKIYEGINEDVAKGKFLTEYLTASKPVMRLWALDKVEQWRVGTTPKLPDGLGPVLINLVSDPDRDVRLKTAKLLALMGELNSAEKLLEQIKIEKDAEVGTELFVALGSACYYAALPNSDIKIDPEITKQTLELATEYLASQDGQNAQKGAEVIKKLLEQEGLNQDDAERYMAMVADRYKKQNKADTAIRADLLSVMAGLCGQSVCKNEAADIFKTSFEESITDEANSVREAAFDGLLYIDKYKALNELRKNLINDNSAVIRTKLIDAAGEIGGKEDLAWLVEKINSNAESEPAWQAALKILKRIDAAAMEEWLPKLISPNALIKLSDDQMIVLLEAAEKKALAENKARMLKNVRIDLARLYNRKNDYKQAAEYLGMLRETAQTPEEKETVLAAMLNVYLRWANIDLASQLMNNCLLEKDLEPNGAIINAVNDYISRPPEGAKAGAVMEAFLAKVNPVKDRPKWHKQLQEWTDYIAKGKGTNGTSKSL
jgi:HEAT repeat protein